jgi:hypothetical protein
MKAGPMETETPARRGGCVSVTGGTVDVGSWMLSGVGSRRREEIG